VFFKVKKPIIISIHSLLTISHQSGSEKPRKARNYKKNLMTNAYFLNGQNLEQYGLIPGKAPDSNIALSGAWDMPSRIGKTHHIWADDNSLEPYLRADEIFFGGRDLSFHFYVKASNRRTAVLKCYGLFDLINSFTDLVPFESVNFGYYMVLLKDEVKIDYIGSGMCKGVLTMRQPVVNMTGYIPPSDTNTQSSIDKISLASLGFEVVSMTDQYDRPAAKSTDVTSYGYEGAKVARVGFRTINLELVTKKNGYQYGFLSTIKTLMALLAAPNARTLIHNGITREVFAKDGFKVTMLYKNGEQYTAKVVIPLTEIRVLESWNLLTDRSGLVLTDASGIPITEILKMR
jgi:hypothetical protein